MLVLSRKIGERLVVGDTINVVVLRINGNRVTLGIDAPRAVGVRRGEIQPKGADGDGEDSGNQSS